jgi:excisionase family DNA binding protein
MTTQTKSGEPSSRYLTKHEAAAYINCSLGLIRLALASGGLKAYRPRRNVIRFRVEDIDAWMANSYAQSTGKEGQAVS